VSAPLSPRSEAVLHLLEAAGLDVLPTPLGWWLVYDCDGIIGEGATLGEAVADAEGVAVDCGHIARADVAELDGPRVYTCSSCGGCGGLTTWCRDCNGKGEVPS
jgi:hypothetical protein